MGFNSELFDRTAGRYDEKPPFFRILGSELVKFANLPEKTSVLDIGAGKGAVTVPALSAVGAGGRVTAIDVSEEMVAYLDGLELPNLTVVHDDILSSTLPEAEFDHAVSGFALHILGDMGVALKQVHRILKNRGTLSWSKPGGHPDASEWENVYGQIYATFTRRLGSEPPEMAEEMNVDAVVRAAGFSVCEQTTIPLRLPVGDAESYWEWTQTHGARWLTDMLSPQDARELRIAVVDSLLNAHPTQGRDIMVAPIFTKLQHE